MTDGGEQPAAAQRQANRLAGESSPYLLQHAHNPVAWYSWGEEAFAAARAADKMIFLSVGYSTCYWCHVMERESFENEAIAAVMNEHFICVKVDREQRPDVDDIYMTAVQEFTRLTTGHPQGGWPMSVWLDPHTLKPFFAGTYFPPKQAFGRAGFPQVCEFLAETWRTRRAEVIEQAEALASAVIARLNMEALPRELNEQIVEQAVGTLLAAHDAEHGGFGSAPKFPQPVYLELLMACAWEKPAVQAAITLTLDHMAMGGMYDQVGGGFHRYSVDEKWLVPHFEKMLYDNAQLALVYSRAAALTGEAYYSATATEILDYVRREMTGPHGGFYSAQDAEVDAKEGASYVWTPDEVRAVLTDAGIEDHIDLALLVFGLDLGPNFRDPHHPDLPPTNVLFLSANPSELAEKSGLDVSTFHRRVMAICKAMLQARNKRKQPGTDDKILAGWNGLMIAAMAENGRVQKKPRFIEATKNAAAYVLTSMRDADGGLVRSRRGDAVGSAAFLEDYAFVVQGLIALHRATNDETMLAEAKTLVQQARMRFWDEARGGWYDTLADQRDLFVRTKSMHDGAVPSGNTVMLNNLLDLHELAGDKTLLDDAAKALGAMSHVIASDPVGCALGTVALHRFLAKHPERIPQPAAEITRGREAVTVIAEPANVIVNDNAATFDLVIDIADGYHINAHEPDLENMIGLVVRSLTPGVEITADYPPGRALANAPAGADGLLVYSGSVRMPVHVRLTTTPQHPIRLALIYQVCSNTFCLEPTRHLIPVEFTKP